MNRQPEPGALHSARNDLLRRAEALEADAARLGADWDALVWQSARATRVRAEVAAHRSDLTRCAAELRAAAAEIGHRLGLIATAQAATSAAVPPGPDAG